MEHLTQVALGIGGGIVGMLFFIALRMAEIRNVLQQIRDKLK